MNRFLLFLYKISPSLLKTFIGKNGISLKMNFFLLSLIKKKDLHSILPYLNTEFLKICGVDMQHLSYLIFESFFSEDFSKNKIIINICSQLIENDNPTKENLLEEFLNGKESWLYSLLDMSTNSKGLSDSALEIIEYELNKENAFLDEELVAMIQLSNLVYKNHHINYFVFMKLFNEITR